MTSRGSQGKCQTRPSGKRQASAGDRRGGKGGKQPREDEDKCGPPASARDLACAHAAFFLVFLCVFDFSNKAIRRLEKYVSGGWG